MNYATYYRVSTDRQGNSGLGLEAQQDRVRQYVASRGGTIAASFQDVLSGAKRSRPGLSEAMNYCRQSGAVLLVARLDRLARDVKLLLEILDSGIDVAFPELDVDTTTPMGRAMVQFLGVVAELERGMISERTKAALAQSRKRAEQAGEAWGHAAHVQARRDEARRRELVPVLDQLHRSGIKSVRRVAGELNRRGLRGVRGGCWGLETTSRLLRWYRRECVALPF